ncbi:MAG: type II toxin-antitoxin system RelE/ParE family toxin [Planctomycetaceae bacterium]|nr:type II toxin-antitoxin system RelE/ParE family toxin [Planctomycetaceae bacterium]
MTHRLRILKRAEADVEDIYSWLEERSPEGAERWLAAFEMATERLLSNPTGWPLAPENEFVDYEVRHFAFKTRRGRKYRALYTIVSDEIRILHVRGGRQNTMSEPGPPDDD